MARLDADGSLGATFNAGVDSFVNVVTTQADGKILILGSFTRIQGVARNSIARLNANGSVDGSFDPGRSSNDFVSSITPISGGKMLIMASFMSSTPLGLRTA